MGYNVFVGKIFSKRYPAFRDFAAVHWSFFGVIWALEGIQTPSL
jgi:hypothetical protein